MTHKEKDFKDLAQKIQSNETLQYVFYAGVRATLADIINNDPKKEDSMLTKLAIYSHTVPTPTQDDFDVFVGNEAKRILKFIAK